MMRPRVRSGRRRRDEPVRAEPVHPILRNLPPVNVLDEAGVETIHRASMRLLRDVGMLIVDFPRALETFRQNGAKVEGERVWIDEATLMHFVSQAPPSFTWRARNPANSVPIGGSHTVLAPVYGPPFVSEYKQGRRPSTLADFHNFAKLTAMTPHLHCAGGVLCEPNDVPNAERHLDMLLGHITLSDKAFLGSVTHAHNAVDTVTILEILFGKAAVRETPCTMAIVNASSPLRYDDRMFGVVEVYAKANQPAVFTPFIIAGAMSPSTMAATIAQLNAETLFGICYAQMVNPGCPAVYGSFLANIDMRSGAPCFGTAENTLAMFAGGQMARRYNIPYRSGGNFTASRIPDAQAGYESAGTMWPTIQAGTHFVLHAAGWLEGGLIASFEKFVIDLEMCAMVERYARGIALSDEDFAWDAYEEAGPGQHFLGTAHTMRHYRTAFHQHNVFSMDNYEKWEEEGSEDTYKKANAVYKKMLRRYEKPELDEAVLEELNDFVVWRRGEIQKGRPPTEWRS